MTLSSANGPGRPRQTWPWMTVVLAGVSTAAFFIPAFGEALVYDRSRLVAGEEWRVWTGHLAHWNLGHWFWNLAVFVPAGIWLERLRPVVARAFLLASPMGISLLLFVAEPGLGRYAGLSGVAAGVLVLLAILQLRRRGSHEPTWFWIAVILVVVGKVAAEMIAGQPLLGEGFRNVPLAHVGGLAGAAATGLLVRRAGDEKA